MSLSQNQFRLKEEFLRTGAKWSQEWETILNLDPDYFAAYAKLRAVPKLRNKLSAKIQALVLLSVDASCTHLWPPGILQHTRDALEAGATKAEIMETLELTSVLGVHSVNVGIPLLLEVLDEEGMSGHLPNEGLDAQKEALKADFQAKRGYWHSTWEAVLRLDPEYFEAYKDFSSVPFEPSHQVLEPKVKELIYCAIDCATTHLYQPGLKLHIRNAIKHGASPEEVMEVFELASLMGIQTAIVAAPILEAA